MCYLFFFRFCTIIIGSIEYSVDYYTARDIESEEDDFIRSELYFNKSELAFADKEYRKEILSYIGELGNRVKKSKLALFDELFDVNQDYKHHARSIDFNKKTWFTRLAKEDALFFATTAGDHYT